MPSELIWLFAGVALILLAGTIAGIWLRRHKPGPVTDNLVARVNAWWIMVGVLSVAFWAGPLGITLLFALLSLGALREFLVLTAQTPADRLVQILTLAVALPVQYWLIWDDWYGLYAIFIPVYAFLALTIVTALQGDTTGFLGRIAGLHLALMLCVYALSHVPALLYLVIPGYDGKSALLIAFLIFVVQFSDVMQYVWGKLYGCHLIAPALSPSKTWEGFGGGIATATAAGAALWWLTPFSPLQAGAMALAATCMGFCGGLVMSAIKRDRGIKDWGALIAGHGGVLDRTDSLIFAAPIFFHLTRFFWGTT
jgi:phosphatidate cytidylyltransferase